MPVFPGPVCRHLHFPKLNNICHFSGHLTNLSMSSCKFCLSHISLVFLNSLVSSANFNMLPVTPSSKSFMYTNNKIGPSTDPCGTPLNTDFQPVHSLMLSSHLFFCLPLFLFPGAARWFLYYDIVYEFFL